MPLHETSFQYRRDNSTIPEKTACRNLCSSTSRPSESNICSNVAAVSRVHRFLASTRVCACSEVDLIRLGSSGGYCICSKSASESPGLSGKPHSVKTDHVIHLQCSAKLIIESDHLFQSFMVLDLGH